jgi:hypothetical protein
MKIRPKLEVSKENGGRAMEKIINEFRVIETDDGFRIEIKGDKEKIRSFISGFGGPRRWRHWGPGGALHFGPWMGMKGGFCWGPWNADTEADENSEA